MPTASTTLSIIVKLQDEASAAMQGLGSNLKSIGDGMTSVGKTMTTDITLPLVAFATYAAKGAMDFQQAMTQVQTQAGASATEVQALSDQVMNLAQSSEQGPTDLANALFHLVSLGLNSKNAMSALQIASEGAAVGQANLEDVTNALGGAISSGIKGTSDYAGTMATLNAIIGSGNMRMTDLVNALGTGILASARVAGLSIQDVGAALATMTDNGIPAEDAATRLRMTFQLMAAPSTQAKKSLESLGMTQFQLANDMRSKGLLGALQDLQDHLSKVSADQQTADLTKIFGGARSGSAVELLLTNMDKLQSKYTTIDSGVKNFQSDVQAQADTWNGEMANMNANLQVFRDGVGTSLLQIANQVFPVITNLLQNLLRAWEGLSPGMQKAIIYIGLAAVTLGPLLVAVGMLTTAIGSVISFIGGFISVMSMIVTAVGPVITAIGAVVTAIGVWPIVIGAVVVAIIALIVTHWTQVTQFTMAAWDGIKNLILDAWQAIVQMLFPGLGALVTLIVDHWNAISSATTMVWGGIKTFFTETWNWVKALFTASLNEVSGVWNEAWQGISDFVGNIWNTIKSNVKAGFNDIITAINGFIHALDAIHISIPSIAIPGTKLATPSLNLGFTIPDIPKLADGGFVTRPTLALIGEAGPEAVMPLSAMGAGPRGAGATQIVVNINGGIFPADQSAIKQIGDLIARQITRQVRVVNYAR